MVECHGKYPSIVISHTVSEFGLLSTELCNVALNLCVFLSIAHS